MACKIVLSFFFPTATKVDIFLISGKYGTEIRPAFVLNVPYLFVPVWAGMRIFRASHAFPKFSTEKVRGSY